MSDILLEAKNVCKSFYKVPVLSDVSICVPKGSVVSLVGENGAGKSTLGNIISGSLKPDTGEIIFDGKRYESLTIKQAEEIGIVMVHQELVMLPELSVTANIFIGSEYTHMGLLDESSMKTQAEQLLKEVGLNLSPDTLVKDIDVAGCQMIEIARAISGDAKLIILDEPTSSLSEKEIEHLFSIVRRLKKKGVSFILVSHHLQEVMDISDNIYVLKDGHLVTSLDPTSCSIDDIIVNMVGRSLEDFYHRKRNHFGGEAIKLENFSGINVGKRYLNTSCPQNINLTVNEGEIVGISGLVGAGRTELIKLIFCDDPKTADSKLYLFGEQREFRNYKKAIDNGLAWITEDRKHEGLILQFSILSNIALPILDFFKNLLFINRKKEANTVDEYMQKLNVKAYGSHQLAQYLSGGNQQKVVIAKWLAKQPKILVLDEPTRGIDLGAKAEIYRLINGLTDKGMAILLVSSELPELIGLCDRILVMHEGKITGEFSRSEFSETDIMSCATGRSTHL